VAFARRIGHFGTVDAMSIADVAVALGQQYPVFPCLPDKSPACPRGFKAAGQDPDHIRRLWKRHPGELIGVPTGIVSGIDILDIDPRHDGMTWWAAHQDAVPVTRTHRTRSGGLHVVMLHHEIVRNSQSKIAPGVDTRGQGGYAIWWPAHGGTVDHADLIDDWPAWLLRRLKPTLLPPAPKPATRAEADMRAAIMIERAFARVRDARPGQRHHTLRAAAKTVGGLLHALGMSTAELERYLVDLIMSTGAEDRANAERTARWAVEWGRNRPLL
jgi:hypothetical protein